LPLISEGISNVHMQKHGDFAVLRVPPGLGPRLPKCSGFHCKAAESSQADNGSHPQFLKAKLCLKLKETK